ncbi:MAG: acylphosphatase [Pseudomonadota bacterium]
MERLHLVIHGRVQGVFFRANAQKEASNLGLCGWVRNTADGGVETVAEGERPDLEAFAAWCRRGPPHAMVQKVDISWEASEGMPPGFRIEY